MEDYFRELADTLCAAVGDDAVLLVNYQGEDSDFARLNRNRIRQAGHVRQQELQLALVRERREATAALPLTGDRDTDLREARALLARLGEQLPLLPEDPHLNYATTVTDSRQVGEDRLPGPADALAGLMQAAEGLDLVGLWAGGEQSRGFANSLGQFNWHSRHSYNLDWSVYLAGDKAVKQSDAGLEFDAGRLAGRIAAARETLQLLGKAPRSLEPGRYRVFLAPAAMHELMELVSWGGFGLKSHRTAQTPLLALARGERSLHPAVHIREHHAAGLAPRFTRSGFAMPERVELVTAGGWNECLANARSAREYGVAVNCGIEHPQSLEIDGGELDADDVFRALDTGLYVSNLWYCNYSDRNHCRVTGMTRFACLWVEGGRPVAPVGVMRFDESLYHVLGDRLEALTREPEHILDSGSYEWRSTASARLPGALVDGFTFTL